MRKIIIMYEQMKMFNINVHDTYVKYDNYKA